MAAGAAGARIFFPVEEAIASILESMRRAGAGYALSPENRAEMIGALGRLTSESTEEDLREALGYVPRDIRHRMRGQYRDFKETTGFVARRQSDRALELWYKNEYGERAFEAVVSNFDIIIDADYGYFEDDSFQTKLENALSSGNRSFPWFDRPGSPPRRWVVFYTSGQYQHVIMDEPSEVEPDPLPFAHFTRLTRPNDNPATDWARNVLDQMVRLADVIITCPPHENQDNKHVTIRVKPSPRTFEDGRWHRWGRQFHVYVQAIPEGAYRGGNVASTFVYRGRRYAIGYDGVRGMRGTVRREIRGDLDFPTVTQANSELAED